jgi:hypothetical protein
MSAYYFKRDDGREWFSISLDNDEFGQEAVSTLMEKAANLAIQKTTLGDFKAASEYIDIAADFAKALRQGQAHDEKAE